MQNLDYLQWPAFAVTVVAAWLISSSNPRKRRLGFWVFLLSNLLWISWGLGDRAYALIALQCCLSITNMHGVYKNRAGAAKQTPPHSRD
jgi:hypothetical protein